jgi:hypothetical protein
MRSWHGASGLLAVGVLTYIACVVRHGGRSTAQGAKDEACGNVVEWAQSHGASFPKLAVTDFFFQVPGEKVSPGLEWTHTRGGDGGATKWFDRIARRRGTMATTTIEAGEEVLSVPSSILLSVENARASPELKRLFDEYGDVMDDYTVLALFILREYSKGAESKFWPYLCSMPRPSDMTTTLYWSKHELRMANITAFTNEDRADGRMYKGNLALQTERLRQLLLHKYNTHVPILLASFPDLFQRDFLNFSSWTWALTLVYSRNWGVTDPRKTLTSARPHQSTGSGIGAYGKSSHTLVPLADLLNHHDPVTDPLSCFLDWRSNGTRMAMIARRRYERGEEVFTSYGSDCNDRFIVGYGFAPWPRGHDVRCQRDLRDFSASRVKTGVRG